MKKDIKDLRIGDYVYVITEQTDVVHAKLFEYKISSEPCLISSEIINEYLEEEFEIKMYGGNRGDEVTINDYTYSKYDFVCHEKSEIPQMLKDWNDYMLKFLVYRDFDNYE